MKIYISADIEGVAGITEVSEADPSKPDWQYFRNQMTLEVAAACEGALAAGAKEIVVKDAHHHARNIDPSKLPRQAQLLRGWSGHPQLMVDMLDSSFDALICIGYHSRAGSAQNPLAHTMSGRIHEILINGVAASEFFINSTTAAMHGVPAVFLSGDAALCAESKARLTHLVTAEAFTGRATACLALHPEESCAQIRSGVQQALSGDLRPRHVPNPERFKISIEYKSPVLAYGKSFYPGVNLRNERFMHFESNDWFEVLRMFAFVL